MKLKLYESPAFYFLDICTVDVISSSSIYPDETEKANSAYGSVDGGKL